ncbi:hypothetical protein D1B33_08195 [Lysinibacillus yapensis]|uniref:Uncharacterized protein n=1 Tax=Ureibacillus yapensis TaxID=2304605 RepID=A0A396SFR4_9BACL|nr:hypothetical protein D1B33_08195 [Lysinibacillus yapensis]
MFFKLIADEVRFAQLEFRKHRKTKRIVLGSLLACMAAVLQAAGGFLPGVGYMISPFATLPILIGAMFSLQMGVMAYFLTILLLFILFPSELVIFPFTTGLMGIGIGAAFSFFSKRISIILIGGFLLSLGILCLLYVFRFPVLGPTVSNSFSFLATGGILIFSFLYSWLWFEFALFFFKKIKDIFTP